MSVPNTIPGGEDDPSGVSAMPLPPIKYINNYSDSNIAAGKAPLPPIPIKVLPEDNYTMFGIPFSVDDQIVRPLEDQGLRRLYPQTYDHRRELRKLNHSILVNFIDLLDVLIRLPESNKRQEKMDDLTLLFIHVHHLINQFRPHQARETLKAMLNAQLSGRKDIIDKFQKRLEQASKILTDAISSLPDNASLQTSLKFATEPMNTLSDHMIDNLSDGDVDMNTLRDDMMCDIIDAIN